MFNQLCSEMPRNKINFVDFPGVSVKIVFYLLFFFVCFFLLLLLLFCLFVCFAKIVNVHLL